MLFLLNDIVTDIAAPELRLLRREISFCDDVQTLRPAEAIEWARRRLQSVYDRGELPSPGLIDDLAALIIARTGANAALFPLHDGRVGQARLAVLPDFVLTALHGRLSSSGGPDPGRFWTLAA